MQFVKAGRCQEKSIRFSVDSCAQMMRTGLSTPSSENGASPQFGGSLLGRAFSKID